MNLQQHIKIIGQQMVEILAGGMKSGKIALSRAKEIANFYLNDVEKAQSETDLEIDMQVMEQSMPEMSTVVTTEKMRKKQMNEDTIKAQVEQLLKEGKVEEAARLAKQASSK